MIMNIDEKVMEFVEAAKYCVHTNELTEDEQIRIKTIFDDCLSAVILEYCEDTMPSFIICDTYNKYSEVLPVNLCGNEHKYYILYDYHLNQINRLFDALYLDNNDTGHDIWKLSYELFAEDALLNNDEFSVLY